MELTPKMFMIVCPLLFLAGFVDAIGGGGGLISLPGYVLAGVPIHQAIATNKLSSTCGTGLTALRFIRQGLVEWKIALPTVAVALRGPYDLAGLPESVWTLAAFEYTEQSIRAVARVLRGEAEPTGRLPVTL